MILIFFLGTCDCSSCGAVTGKVDKGKGNGGLSEKEKAKLEENEFENDLLNAIYYRPWNPNIDGDLRKRRKRSLSSSDSNITSNLIEVK